MTGLVEWLTAILDEHERIARAAIPGPWTVADNGEVIAGDRGARDLRYVTCDGEGLLPSVWETEAAHIALHDPVAVLADIAAKRAIIAECVEWLDVGELKPGTEWNDQAAGAECARTILRFMASGYADHDGYLEEWKP